MPQVIPLLIQAASTLVAVAQVVSVIATVASFFIKPKSSSGRGNSGLALMVRESDYPRRLLYGKGRLGGIWFYVETLGVSNEDIWLVLGICDGVTKGPQFVYFNDEEIEIEVTGVDANGVDIYEPRAALNEEETEDGVGKYRGTAYFTFHKGDQTEADARLVEASAGNWTTNCKLLGISYAVVNLEYDTDLYSGGVPEISFLWEGQSEVFDPRDESTSYTDNAALCLAHYMTLSRIGPNADYSTELDLTSLRAAASACDEEVATLAGSEKRYTTDGVISVEKGPEANISAMLTAMSGFTSYAGGRFTFGAAVWIPPSFELTLDHIIKVNRFQNRVPKRSRVNTVKGLFISSANLYQSSDFPARTNSSYVEEDGEELVYDLDLQFTESPSRAQRLAKIELEDRRLQRVLEVDCTLEAFRAQAGKNIMVTIPRYGMDRAPFLVEGFSFAVGDDGSLIVKLTLNETASTIYDWDASEELPVEMTPVITNNGINVSPLIAEPAPGAYASNEFPVDVELSTLTADASIRWSKTFTPESVGSGNEYTGVISMEANEVLFARAFKADHADSPIFVGVYGVEQVARPAMSPTGGIYPADSYPRFVTAVTSTPGASIRWKKGSEPADDQDGTLYAGPISVDAGDLLFVRAFKPGQLPSSSSFGQYTSS